jgi:hypothetical protein
VRHAWRFVGLVLKTSKNGLVDWALIPSATGLTILGLKIGETDRQTRGGISELTSTWSRVKRHRVYWIIEEKLGRFYS